MAGRARPDGAARGDVTAGTLERLETRAVHQRQQATCLRLAEDGVTSQMLGRSLRRAWPQKRTCTFAPYAIHTLQRVHRDRSERARAFLRTEAQDSDRAELSLGRLGQALQQPVENAGAVELECVVAGVRGHLGPFLAWPGHCEIECVGYRTRAVDRNDHRGVADSLADPARGRGDYWTAAGQHLLHQRDAEGFHELWARLAWQTERCAACHQVRLLLVVDIVQEPDPICRRGRCGEFAEVLRVWSIARDDKSEVLTRRARKEPSDQIIYALGARQSG